MKKVLIIVIAVVALVACLAIARWADQNTKVPTSTPPATSTATTQPSTTEQQPSTTAPTPGDIENGLGWG